MSSSKVSDQTAALMKRESQTAQEGESQTAHEGVSQTEHEGESQTAHEGVSQTTHKGESQTAQEGVSQTAHEGESQTAHEGESQTAQEGVSQTVISVGSRRSELALRQTHEVLRQLGDRHRFSIVHMDTIGDQILDRALSHIGDKGLFTRELDAALLSGQVSLVVHSLKDLPTQCPDGLIVPCILRRDLPADALVLHPRHSAAGVRDLAGLPPGSVLGTSSLRRAAQLSRAHPGLRFESVRGNLGTRWRKLVAQGSGLDGLILAEAGLARLGWSDRVACRLDCLPAVGQGALAVQCRAGDLATVQMLRPLTHRDTFLEVTAERSLLRALDGGCSVPLGVRASWEAAAAAAAGRLLRLEARVLSIDGSEVVEFSAGVRMDEANDWEKEEEEAAAGPTIAKRLRLGDGDGDGDGEERPESCIGLRYPAEGPLGARDRRHLAECVRLGRLVADGLLERGAGPVLAAAKAAAKVAVGKLQPPQRVERV